MTRAYAEAPATHFRLSDETWAIIAEEYKNGATAKDLGAKWKVAPSSVYRHACADGFTKKKMGGARARAHARMVEEEEAATRAMHPVGSRALKGLFSPERTDRPEAADAAHLARVATLASGRAMAGRLWAEAKALAGLAESYARLADRGLSEGVTMANVPMELIAEIAEGRNPVLRKRVYVPGRRETDPELPFIRRFHAVRMGAAQERERRVREAYNNGLKRGKGEDEA